MSRKIAVAVVLALTSSLWMGHTKTHHNANLIETHKNFKPNYFCGKSSSLSLLPLSSFSSLQFQMSYRSDLMKMKTIPETEKWFVILTQVMSSSHIQRILKLNFTQTMEHKHKKNKMTNKKKARHRIIKVENFIGRNATHACLCEIQFFCAP